MAVRLEHFFTEFTFEDPATEDINHVCGQLPLTVHH